MAILSNVLGLDLGSHSLKAVELRQSLRGFEAVALRVLPASPDDPELAEWVQHFVRMHRLSTDHIVTALAGDRISTRRFSFPFRDRKKLTQAVPFEVEGDTLFDLEEVIVDWEIAGGNRHHTDVVASIARRDEVSELLESLDRVDCPPRTLEAEGMVLGNLSAVFDLPGTRLLVDMGHRKTTCCLVSDGQSISARTFPVAGAAITEALARDRSLSSEAAEIAKCESGVFGGSTTDAPPQAEAVLTRIAREIIRTAGSLESVIGGLDSGPLRQVTLMGGTAQLGGLAEFLSERTGIETQRLGLPIEGKGNGLVAGGSPILFAPAIALAVRGTAQANTRTNLRQQEFALRLDLGRYRRDLFWPGVLAAAVVALAIIDVGTSTWLESRRASQVESQVEQLFTEVFPGRALPDNALAALRTEVRSAAERAEFLGVYRGNLSALDLLTEISRRVSTDLDVVFEELSIDKQVIRMRVYATSFEAADRLGAELAKFAPFARARIGAIETDKKRGGKRFNVTISLADTGSSA